MAGTLQITSFDSISHAASTPDVELPDSVELDCGDELDIHMLFALMPVFFEECTRSFKSFHDEHKHGMVCQSDRSWCRFKLSGDVDVWISLTLSWHCRKQERQWVHGYPFLPSREENLQCGAAAWLSGTRYSDAGQPSVIGVA